MASGGNGYVNLNTLNVYGTDGNTSGVFKCVTANVGTLDVKKLKSYRSSC